MLEGDQVSRVHVRTIFVRRLVVVRSDLEALGYSAGQTASFTMSIQPAGLRQPVETVCENDCEGLQIFPRRWWSQTGSNRRPQACKASALPTELWPHWKPLVSVEQTLVGPGRFELPTPRLSSVCSNQLSYGPSPAAPAHTGSCRTGLAITSPLSCFQAARGSRKRNEDGDETAICFCCDVRSRSEDQEQSVQLLGSSRSEVRLHTLEHP